MIICDTGPLIAVLNADDKDHVPCRSVLESESGPLIVPAPVLTEVCYLASTRLGAHAEAAFLDSLATIDHRHFRALRPRHCPAFELLPG